MGGVFSKPKPPKLEKPEPVEEEKKKTKIDPNRSEQIAEARKQKQAVAARAGRRNLRVDLEGDQQRPTRTGISIG